MLFVASCNHHWLSSLTCCLIFFHEFLRFQALSWTREGLEIFLTPIAYPCKTLFQMFLAVKVPTVSPKMMLAVYVKTWHLTNPLTSLVFLDHGCLKAPSSEKRDGICEFPSDLLIGFAASEVRGARDQQFKSGRVVLDGRAESAYLSSPLQEKKESFLWLVAHLYLQQVYNSTCLMVDSFMVFHGRQSCHLSLHFNHDGYLSGYWKRFCVNALVSIPWKSTIIFFKMVVVLPFGWW